MKKKYHYLITVEYLGFRYHGWAKQPALKTIQGELEKNIRYILTHDQFTTLGASRTDAMVSAEMNAFSLFTDDQLTEDFISDLNDALPQEIKTLSIKEVDIKFNVINHSKSKIYHYRFSNSKNFNVLESHLCAFIKEDLDIELMKTGSELFIGQHSFHNFCYKPKENTTFTRLITNVSLTETDPGYYLLKVCGTGFLRHQIRIIVGALLNLGQRRISLTDIENSLIKDSPKAEIGFIAPASGLLLKHIEFKK